MDTDQQKVEDPILSLALNYWAEVVEETGFPSVECIDPLRMPRKIIGYVILAEYLNPEGLVRYRLVGEEMATKWGENFTGKTSEDTFSGSYRTYLEGLFKLTYESRRPVYSESVFRWDVGGVSKTQRLMMPFSEKRDQPPTRCLVTQVWPGGGYAKEMAFKKIINDDDIEFTHSGLQVM